MKKLLWLNFILFVSLFSVNAQTAATVAKNDSTTAERRQQSFEKVWNTVNEKHYDPTFGGVDWQKMREIYQPKAQAAKTNEDFNGVLNQMLGELKLSHFAVFPPFAVADDSKTVSGVTGIELKWIDNQAVISRLPANSTLPADLKTGFVINKINDKTVVETLAAFEKYAAAQKLPEAKKNLYRQYVVQNALNGDTATKVKIEALDGRNQPQVFELTRVAQEGEMSAAIGNFPAQEVVFESKILPGGIGYIRFNIWVIPQLPKIREALRQMKDAPGIIFDLRGNPGGVAGIASGIAGYLSDKQISLGTMKNRTNEMKFIVYPQTAPFAGKIAILTDGGSASTSEVFAAGMQENDRATIVGERSAGQILVSVFDTLPTGALFQYPISDYKSPKNVLIEGRGVIPDVEVKNTRQTLLDGRDAPLEEAVKIINSKK